MIEENEILSALKEGYNDSFISVEFYRDGGSISYIVFSTKEKYFLRIIRSELLSTALRSLDIHVYLQNKNFSVPTIVFTKYKKPHYKTIHKNNTLLMVLYKYIEGTEPSYNDTERVGELIGQLHEMMKDNPLELKIQEKHFFIDRYINILQSKSHVKTEEYRNLGDKLWEKVKDMPRGYCHCDLYPGNVFLDKDSKLYVLDFDTSCNAFPLYDITLFCNETDYFKYSDEGFEKSVEKLKLFLKGYQKYHKLTKKEVNSFFYFLAVYHFQLQATIVEIYGVNCNKDDFEDKQLEWIYSWLRKAKSDFNIEI